MKHRRASAPRALLATAFAAAGLLATAVLSAVPPTARRVVPLAPVVPPPSELEQAQDSVQQARDRLAARAAAGHASLAGRRSQERVLELLGGIRGEIEGLQGTDPEGARFLAEALALVEDRWVFGLTGDRLSEVDAP